jgi:hypothetical protein
VGGALAIALIVIAFGAVTDSAYATSSPGPARVDFRTSSATLGSGEIEGDSWSAAVSGPHGSGTDEAGAKDRPCLSVQAERFGGGGATSTCTFSQSLTPAGGGLWVTTSEPDQAETATAMTAVAMVFAPAAAYVKATLRDGTVETIGLGRLTQAQARAAGLKRLRYTAFATTGAWCMARLESFDRGGQSLWRSGDLRKKPCPLGG